MSNDEIVKRERIDKRKALLAKVKTWIDELNPLFILDDYQVNEYNELVFLSGVIHVEPLVQVRMTNRSAAYMPGPVRYNAWKRKIAESIKKTLRKEIGEWKPFPKYVYSIFKFYISDSKRFKMCDKSNFVKAIEDAINACSTKYDEDDFKEYPYLTEPNSIWIDDRMLKLSGEGEGVYFEPIPSHDRIEIFLQVADIEEPQRPKRFRVKKTEEEKQSAKRIRQDIRSLRDTIGRINRLSKKV